MRSRRAIAFILLCAAGCREPQLDFHAVRSADSPIKNEMVDSLPCEDCMSRSWSTHDGRLVAMQVERKPFLSVPANRLSEPEIVHGTWMFRPYCDSYSLSFRLAISLEEMTRVAEIYRGRPAVAIVGNRVIDAGRYMIDGETITLSFTERKPAIEAAGLLGASPTFREEDGSLREEIREHQAAILDELFDRPEELQRFASEHGLQVEDLDREELAALVFCPLCAVKQGSGHRERGRCEGRNHLAPAPDAARSVTRPRRS